MAAPVTTVEGEERARREVAQRVFAAELVDAKHSIKEDGERSPRYVISRYGARANRVLLVGALTRVESGQNQPGSYRATLVDPTGSITLWAGQYEPEAAAQLGNIQPPELVAVVGKVSARDVDGTTYVNIRPETIRVVQKADREAWVLETARHTMLRLDAMREALKLEAPSVEKLVELGFPHNVAEGVTKAIAHYGKPQVEQQAQLLRDALETLLPGGAEKVAATPSFAPASASYTPPKPAAQPAASAAKAAPGAAAAKESPHKDLVLDLVASLDDGKGAPWEDIVAHAGKKSVSEEAVEEALNALMDDGLIYEPVLGRLKKT